MAYTRVHADWKNKPDTSTPVDDVALEHIEQGIVDAHEAIDALPAPLVLGTTAGTALAGNTTIPAALPALSQANAEAGTATVASSVTAAVLKAGVVAHGIKIGTTAGTALAGNTTIPAATAAGTRAQLDAGTDTVVRAFSAKDIADFVAAQIAAIPPA
ncbi:MAG: hypothetical protein WA972_21075 [Rhodococcus qingshengii]